MPSHRRLVSMKGAVSIGPQTKAMEAMHIFRPVASAHRKAHLAMAQLIVFVMALIAVHLLQN